MNVAMKVARILYLVNGLLPVLHQFVVHLRPILRELSQILPDAWKEIKEQWNKVWSKSSTF